MASLSLEMTVVADVIVVLVEPLHVITHLAVSKLLNYSFKNDTLETPL